MDKTEFSTPSRLIILGNGFDLQAGLKSSFNDYYHSLGPEVINELESNINKIKKNKEIDNRLRCAIHNKSNLPVLFPLNNQTNLTFWDYILSYKFLDENDPNWSNVEAIIQSFPTKYIDSLFNLKDGFTNVGLGSDIIDICKYKGIDSKDKDKTVFYLYIMSYVFQLTLTKRDEIIDFLLSQLHLFENKFKEYLDIQINNQDYNENRSYQKKAKEILNKLSHGEPFNILSFNYTIPTALDNYNLRNIHGDLNGNIIIGIDQSAAKDNENDYLFTKTYRIMELANDKKERHSLNPNIKSIVFYGHSLAAADYSYFQSIFDFYSIYDSDVTLVFYYSVYKENDRETITRTQFDSIRNLLIEYGTTLDNKDHGKNLLHKLLLEDRLIIKELNH